MALWWNQQSSFWQGHIFSSDWSSASGQVINNKAKGQGALSIAFAWHQPFFWWYGQLCSWGKIGNRRKDRWKTKSVSPPLWCSLAKSARKSITAVFFYFFFQLLWSRNYGKLTRDFEKDENRWFILHRSLIHSFQKISHSFRQTVLTPSRLITNLEIRLFYCLPWFIWINKHRSCYNRTALLTKSLFTGRKIYLVNWHELRSETNK